MKNNVDLTENHDFRRDIFNIKKNFKQMIGDVEHSQSRFATAERNLIDTGLIYQGDKNERNAKRLVNSFNDMVECDRCGAQIAPYENDTLCKFCRKDLWYSFIYDNIFWL